MFTIRYSLIVRLDVLMQRGCSCNLLAVSHPPLRRVERGAELLPSADVDSEGQSAVGVACVGVVPLLASLHQPTRPSL